MITVRFWTNIECAKGFHWPETMAESPQVGDLVRSSSTIKINIELEVVRRTWVAGNAVEVELHLPRTRFASIDSFEKWLTKHGIHH